MMDKEEGNGAGQQLSIIDLLFLRNKPFFFLFACPRLASVGSRVMKASHLNDILWQQNPCMGFALHSLTNFKKMLTAFLPQHLLAPFNHSGGKRNFYPGAFGSIRKGNTQNLTKAIEGNLC